MQTLNKLWALADREGERRSIRPNLVFDPVGLILIRPLENWGYDSTPVNSQSFAYTGGDGVHFGLVDLGEGIGQDSPVVMTVPMAANPKNVILGENLFDFLCLGCESGYFVLEQLSYDWAYTVKSIAQVHEHVAQWYGSLPRSCCERDQELLGMLRAELGLQPLNNMSQKLLELQQQYLPDLIIEDRG